MPEPQQQQQPWNNTHICVNGCMPCTARLCRCCHQRSSPLLGGSLFSPFFSSWVAFTSHGCCNLHDHYRYRRINLCRTAHDGHAAAVMCAARAVLSLSLSPSPAGCHRECDACPEGLARLDALHTPCVMLEAQGVPQGCYTTSGCAVALLPCCALLVPVTCRGLSRMRCSPKGTGPTGRSAST